MVQAMLRTVLVVGAASLPCAALAHPDLETFQDGTFLTTPEIVDCVFEDGTDTQCYQITVGHLPDAMEIGPFCPATLDDAGGIWEWTGENAGLYRLDGEFWQMLDGIGYTFYDEDGNVYSVDNATERPTVDHACIMVSEDTSVEITMLLPVAPVMADSATQLGTVSKVGVALDGIPIFSDAPSVQVTGHLPALDVCGGHVDPGGWFHWHATSSDIETVYDANGIDATCTQAQDASAHFGYAFDGFAMFGSAEMDGSTPIGLDDCNGHVGDTVLGRDVYHYHATDDFPNLPPCLSGMQAQDNFVTTASAGVGALNAGNGDRNEPPRGNGPPPGFAEAATALGVTTEALFEAMEQAGGPRADLADVAAALSVSEDLLREVLPPPPDR